MTKKSWRRAGIAGATIAALAATMFTAPAAVADPTPSDPALLLHYDFSGSGAVTDISGKNNNGTIVGNGATVADGVLTLPGGASNSGAAYVRFPANLFDGKDTLTINTWLRNDTGAGNYAAMFFGSATGSAPAQYWLLNPRNPQGLFKTVVTNGNSATSPWTTEYGISPTNGAQGIAGPTTGTDWGMYTTVITPTSIAGYVNGTLVGTVPTARTVTQFGTNLAGYLGRSTYPDNFFKGSFDDVIVSASAYTPAQVGAMYHASDRVTPAQTLTALNADASAVSLPTEAIAALTLPVAGANFSAIAWQSSNPALITTTGQVTRPTAGQPDATVTLTATFTLGDQSVTRTFPVTIAAIDPQRDLDRTADQFTLGVTVATSNIVLRGSLPDGTTISWQSAASAVIAADGAVTRPAADTSVELTATFAKDGRTATRTYPVTVRAQDAGSVVSYVRSGNTAKTEVLHLAATAAGSPLVAMNNNKGVLYPTFGKGTSRFANPTLFRHPDGTFGMIATDNAASGNVFVYRSSDLTTFTDERFVLTNTQGITVSRADVTYDNGSRLYRVILRTPAGTAFETTTADFTTFSTAAAVTVAAPGTVAGLPSGAIEASALGVTRAELDVVQGKLGRIVNTTVDAGDDISLEAGAALTLPDKVDLGYSDGSAKKLGVTWDTSTVDVNEPGTYTVTGTVNQPVYGDAQGVLVRERADPWVYRDDARTGTAEYYLTGSYPTTQANPGVGYDRIVLRRADSINGLTTATEQVLLWSRNSAAPDTSNGSTIATGAYRYFWAPEFHMINGDYYIFFTSSRSANSPWDIRPAIMKAPAGSDPMVASNWQELGYIKAAPGDSAAFTNFSLDMTTFESGGKHYMVWAEKPGTSDLRMAEFDPRDPSQMTSASIRLSTPNYAWERDGGNVINEGPAVIKSDKEVFVFFSASAVNETYAIGMLRAPIEGDLMAPETWSKTGYPLLTSEDFGGQQNGPGHNSFTIDADGNPVIVYHARPPIAEWIPGANGGLDDPSRHARVKTVHFAADGSAVLNQTRDEELAPANRTVSLQVTVTRAAASLDVTAVVASRCVAGKVVQTVTATNREDFPVSVSIASPYGTKSFGSLAAGKSASAALSTRQTSIATGAITVTSGATVGGQPITIEQSVAYLAANCR